jgi:hypothetical protein
MKQLGRSTWRQSDSKTSMNSGNVTAWGADWAWGLPLIVLTVVFHAYCLSLIAQDVFRRLDSNGLSRHFSSSPIFLVGGTALCATVLHGIEGAVWAVAYCLLGASPDYKSAILYSLDAVTSYGHESLALASHWQMLGALEALNGWILFGLTAAFLFAIVQRAWPDAHSKQV